MLRGDRLDVLIDLHGHTRGTRLDVFVHRVAPVQATWIGYLHTTGLAAIDWYLGDAVMVPPGEESAVMTGPGAEIL